VLLLSGQVSQPQPFCGAEGLHKDFRAARLAGARQVRQPRRLEARAVARGRPLRHDLRQLGRSDHAYRVNELVGMRAPARGRDGENGEPARRAERGHTLARDVAHGDGIDEVVVGRRKGSRQLRFGIDSQPPLHAQEQGQRRGERRGELGPGPAGQLASHALG